MKHKFTATARVFIQAPVDKVWEALTKPHIIRRYFFGTETETDWQVGSPISFKGEWNGKTYRDKGIILENLEFKKICYTYWSSLSGTDDIPENYLTITYLVNEEENGTILEISQDNIRDQSSCEHSESNWRMVLANMKNLLEDSNRVLAIK
jgi:uncharacterized protein YndB with AHSA1/START domain